MVDQYAAVARVVAKAYITDTSTLEVSKLPPSHIRLKSPFIHFPVSGLVPSPFGSTNLISTWMATIDVPPCVNNSELPVELLERILYDAWYTLTPPFSTKSRNPLLTMAASRYRWRFYRAITIVSRDFRRISLEIPFRVAVFRTNGDAQLYQFLIPRRFGAAGKERHDLDIDAFHHSLFKNTTVLLSWTGDAEDFLSPGNLPNGPYLVLHDSKRTIVPDARAVVIERDSIGPVVEDWIFSLQSLAHLHVDLFNVVRPSGLNGTRPSNTNWDGVPRHAKVWNVDSSCVRRLQTVEVSGILPSFHIRASDVILKAQQLILLTPQSLEIPGLLLVNNVHILILNTPPGVDGVSDPSTWQIPAALRAGLCCPIRRKAEKLRIVIRGYVNVNKMAWEEAKQACTARDIELVLDVVS
jgi:hypothetical protein